MWSSTRPILVSISFNFIIKGGGGFTFTWFVLRFHQDFSNRWVVPVA
jgi:hypothetical protein